MIHSHPTDRYQDFGHGKDAQDPSAPVSPRGNFTVSGPQGDAIERAFSGPFPGRPANDNQQNHHELSKKSQHHPKTITNQYYPTI